MYLRVNQPHPVTINEFIFLYVTHTVHTVMSSNFTCTLKFSNQHIFLSLVAVVFNFTKSRDNFNQVVVICVCVCVHGCVSLGHLGVWEGTKDL